MVPCRCGWLIRRDERFDFLMAGGNIGKEALVDATRSVSPIGSPPFLTSP